LAPDICNPTTTINDVGAMMLIQPLAKANTDIAPDTVIALPLVVAEIIAGPTIGKTARENPVMDGMKNAITTNIPKVINTVKNGFIPPYIDPKALINIFAIPVSASKMLKPVEIATINTTPTKLLAPAMN